jgi:hypothetical protein
MSEVRRVRLKLGDAEFEADVPEGSVQPMYDQFLCTLERRNRAPPRRLSASGHTALNVAYAADQFGSLPEMVDRGLLRRLFDLREDGVVTLKVLPKGVERGAEALLLILYGYRCLKNEDGVLATQLHRAAEQSGVPIRWPAYELATYDRFVNRIGQRKGSAYSLNDQGVAMAHEITTRILGAVLIEGQPQRFE